MAVFKCRMCEANLEVTGNTGIVKCEYCGTCQSVTKDETGTIRTVLIESGGHPENLLKRGNLSLEDGKWDDADKYFDRVLDINVEESRAYIGKLLAENRVRTLDDLWESKSWNSVKAMDNFQKAYRFAGDELKKTLDEYYTKWVYREACLKAKTYNIDDLEEAVSLFTSIIDYEDSRERAAKARETLNEEIYRFALLREKTDSISELYLAIKKLESIPDYKDSRSRIEILRARLFELKQEAEESERRKEINKKEAIQKREYDRIRQENRWFIIKIIIKLLIAAAVVFYFMLNLWILPSINYNKAMTYYENGDYDNAIVFFKKADGYKNYRSMIDASHYSKGIQYYENGDYNSAVSAFKAADGYGESNEMIKASYYNLAVICYNNRDYSDAKYYFTKADGYGDSKSMIEEINKKIK